MNEVYDQYAGGSLLKVDARGWSLTNASRGGATRSPDHGPEPNL